MTKLLALEILAMAASGCADEHFDAVLDGGADGGVLDARRVGDEAVRVWGWDLW